MSLKIRYLDAPEGVQETLEVSAEGGNAFSLAENVASGAKDAPWATLEPGVWALDGTRQLLGSDPEPGWWSAETSGEDGAFSQPPVLELTLPTPCSATGLTFTFSPSTDQWCSRVRVGWYNGSNARFAGEYRPDGPRWTLRQTVESFDKLVVELLETNAPCQFAKLQRLEIGQVIDFTGEEIVSVQLVSEIDPSLCQLSADTMTVELVDRQGRNLIPQENQRLELYRDEALKAVQYVVSGTREGKDRYTFSCQSMIGLLEDTFLGGLYTDKPLEELAAEILGDWPFALAEGFRDTTVSGYLSVCTQREALQRLAFAIGAVITTQDSGLLRFEPLPTAISCAIAPGEIFLGATVRTEPRIARVEVTAHSYAPTGETVTLLQDEEIGGEGVLVTFDNPHYGYEISGGTIDAYGDNWVKLTADGAVTLTARTYLHSTVVHSRRNSAAISRELGNYLSVPEDTLIHSGNAKQALDRLYRFAQLRQTLEQDAVITQQRAGDYVASFDPWGTRITGYIASMDATLTQGGTVARLRIPGTEVSMEAVYCYSGQLWAGGWEVCCGC